MVVLELDNTAWNQVAESNSVSKCTMAVRESLERHSPDAVEDEIQEILLIDGFEQCGVVFD